MTSTTQAGSQRKAAFFSRAWERFAQTHEAEPPADPSALPVQETPITDTASQMPSTGRRFSAAIPSAAVTAAATDASAATAATATTEAADASSARLKTSFAESCFNSLSYIAFLALPLLLLVQFAVGYAALAPWLFPQEADFAQSYELMVASGQWLMAPAAFPPVWFWMLRLLNTLPYVDGPVVYTAGAALSGILTLLATWFLALSAGYGRRTAFASGLALLSCLAFPALAHRVGPELLFTGLLTLGLACLLRGWNKNLSLLWLPIGCAFVALAGLTGGLFGIILPVLGTVIFVVWKDSFTRFNKIDAAAGFAVLLVLPLAWLCAAIIYGPGDMQLRTLCAQLIAPFLPPYWPPADPAWLYAAVLPLALVPWMLVPLFVSWGNALARPFTRLASTRKENSGSAWIWIHLALGLLLLSAMSAKFCLDVLPLMPLLAIVLGKAIVNLPQANSRAFFLVLAGLFGLAALALGLAGLAQFWPPLQGIAPLPYPEGFAGIKGLPILAGICLITAFVLWKLVDRRFPGACLLISAVAVTALCLPTLKLTSPSMQDILLESAPATPAPKAPFVQKEMPAAPQEETKTPAPPAMPEAAAPAPIPEQAVPAAPQEKAQTPAPPATPEAAAPAPETEKKSAPNP